MAETTGPDGRPDTPSGRLPARQDPSAMTAEELDERSRLAIEILGLAWWSRDLDAGKVHWDAQMYRLHHRDPAEGPPGLDEWLARHVHEADRGWMAARQRAEHDVWTMSSEVTFRAPAPGGVRWIRAWTRRLWRDGRRQSFGMHMDVTEAHLAERALQDERDRYRLAVDAAGIGVWERQLESGQRTWNESMYRLRGLSPDDPRTPSELLTLGLDPGEADRQQDLLARQPDHGAVYRREWRVRWPDGSEHWLLSLGRVVDGPEGRRLVGINVDITDRKAAEALRQQRAAAERAARDKSAFLARVSHELRTPLNAVVGFSELLLNDARNAADSDLARRLDLVTTSARHLAALVDDLLQLSYLDAGAPGPPAQRVVLDEVLRQVMRWVSPLAQRAGVEVLAEPFCGRAVRAPHRHVEQIVTNLLTNAVKYNRSGGKVWIRLCHDDDSGLCGIAVEDNGRGIEAGQLDRIFEPFERGEAQRSAVDGTGIGLTLSRQLAQGAGGRIEVRSQPGVGSTFIAWLPADRTEPADAPADTPAGSRSPSGTDPAPDRDQASWATAGPPVPAAQSPRTPQQGTRAPAGEAPQVVLCVEDNPVNLLLVRELFALRSRFQLHTAENGHDAIAMAEALAPELLLVDLHLPDIDGIELMRRLRARPALARARFVAFSADAQPDTMVAARQAGFDEYWTKPIDFAQILRRLDALAARAPRADRNGGTA